MRPMRRTAGLAAVVVTVMAGAGVARADEASLYRGPGPRPGPDILYAGARRRAPADQRGRLARRPDPRLRRVRLPRRRVPLPGLPLRRPRRAGGARPRRHRAGDDTFSGANGTYTYPSDPVYAGNAADLVELRVKPLAGRDRLPADAELDERRREGRRDDRDRQLGGAAAVPARRERDRAGRDVPHRPRRERRPARRRHRSSPWPAARRRRAWTASAARSRSASRTRPGTRGAAPCAWPRASGSGTPAAGAYLAPQARRATATQPGGGRPGATAFFNAAFRFDEPLPKVGDPAGTAANPAWWRDQRQGGALQSGDLSAVPRRRGLRQARRRDRRRGRRAAHRRAQPDPRQPLRAQAGRRLRPGVRQLGAAARASCSGACSRTRSTSRRRRRPAAATGCSCCCTRSAPTTTSSPAAATSRSSATAAAGTS